VTAAPSGGALAPESHASCRSRRRAAAWRDRESRRAAFGAAAVDRGRWGPRRHPEERTNAEPGDTRADRGPQRVTPSSRSAPDQPAWRG
jgi:hypothetical protein